MKIKYPIVVGVVVGFIVGMMPGIPFSIGATDDDTSGGVKP